MLENNEEYVVVDKWCEERGVSSAKMKKLLKKFEYERYRSASGTKAKVQHLNACLNNDMASQNMQNAVRQNVAKNRATYESLLKEIGKILFKEFDSKDQKATELLIKYEAHLRKILPELEELSYKNAEKE